MLPAKADISHIFIIYVYIYLLLFNIYYLSKNGMPFASTGFNKYSEDILSLQVKKEYSPGT
jgi:hypothetical protein